MEESLKLRLELDALYADYTACLDDGDYDAWPEFFTETCLYKIIPRENYEQNLPLATMLCESKGMLKDRVYAVKETSMYGPRALRHLVSAIRIAGDDGNGGIDASANYAILQTLNDEETKVFQSGRYLDKLVREDGRLKFKQKLCVFDSNLVSNSLIVPV